MTLPRFAALVCILLAPTIAHAAITAAGDVGPSPPVNNASVFVGATGSGSLLIDDGSQLLSDNAATLGLSTASSGLAHVTGFGSLWRVSSATIGLGGSGRLVLEDGGQFEAAQPVQLGADTFGDGLVRVSGIGSVFSANGVINAVAGRGRIEVLDGGSVVASNFYDSSGQSTVVVSGTQSSLTSDGSIINRGDFHIADGGVASTPLDIFFNVDGGRVTLDGGLIRAEVLQQSAYLGGDGEVEVSSSTIANFGRLEAGKGQTLRFTGGVELLENNSDVTIRGGEITLTGRLDNRLFSPAETGRIELDGGRLRVERSLDQSLNFEIENSSRIAATGGRSDVFGRVLNFQGGEIAVTRDSDLVFHDRVTNDFGGTISITPGSRGVFLGGFDDFGGVLLADLAGTESTTGFGVAEVFGQANLNGVVSAAFVEGFEPSLGDSFTLLTASGGVLGNPALGDVPDLASGLSWDLDVLPNSLVLSVVGPAGDANGDRSVNAADYAAYRDLGGPSLAANLAAWRAAFGDSAGAAAGVAASPIPEPAAGGLALLAGLSAAGRPSRRLRRRLG